jgi:Flp pilus assembly protein TadD
MQGLAYTIYEQGRRKEGSTLYREVLEIRQRVLREQAAACIHQERWDKAIEVQNNVIKLKPDDPIAALIRVQMFLLADRTEEYLQACTTMLQRFGQSEKPHRKCEAARACLLSPDGAGDPTVPLELAEQAVAMRPESAWMHHFLGMAHFRVGQHEEATEQFHESLELDPDWHARHLNWLGLAMVHHKLGETDKARQSYNMAMDRMTNDPAASERVFQDWLNGLIWRREAEELLGIQQAAQEPPQPAAVEPKPAEPEAEPADPKKADSATN